MPTVSVLTAAIASQRAFVGAAGESLTGQELPAGWELEWVVQEDGPSPGLADVVGRFPFARYAANGHQLGFQTTRNLGLARVTGSIVQVLDGDDLMLPGGPGVMISAFEQYPEIHWAAGQADNLMPDGTRVSFDPIFPTGYVAAGAVTDFIVANDRGPFLFNGIAMRTQTVRALGGWVADPVGDDFALVAAITALAPGYYPRELTFLYRQHGDQVSRWPNWETVRRISVTTARNRIAAMRETKLRIGVA